MFQCLGVCVALHPEDNASKSNNLFGVDRPPDLKYSRQVNCQIACAVWRGVADLPLTFLLVVCLCHQCSATLTTLLIWCMTYGPTLCDQVQCLIGRCSVALAAVVESIQTVAVNTSAVHSFHQDLWIRICWAWCQVACDSTASTCILKRLQAAAQSVSV